jgi:hypothetical protein
MKSILRIMMLVIASGAVAQSFYVATTGSDSNNGSSSTPWRTIGHASGLAQPGWVVHVASGTYNENVFTGASGTSGSPITFISDTKWGAKVVGSGCSPDSGGNCVSGKNATWQVQGAFVTIQNFEITGDGHIGIQDDSHDGNELNNHIHDITGPGACGAYSGGIAGIDNTNALVADTTLKNNNAIGNWIHDIAWLSGTFCGGGGHGVYQASPGGRVENNLVYRGSGQGLTQFHWANSTNFTNNTVFQFGDGINLCDGNSPVSNNVVSNNIVRNISGYGIRDCNLPDNSTYHNNLVYQNGINIQSGITCTACLTTDPLFVNWQIAGGGDYHLTSGSPAVDAGTSVSAPTTDFDGVPRPQGSAWDIGAYEYVVSGSATVPSAPTGLIVTVQ